VIRAQLYRATAQTRRASDDYSSGATTRTMPRRGAAGIG
jgi:hypothetical protein